MIDTLEFGLGAVQSPPDVRDWPISSLFATVGVEAAVTIPASFVVPAPLPPVLNQGNTPMCAAYSTACLKGYEDRIDQGQFYNFDKPTFFRAIGGGVNGAILRDAFARMLGTGYPVVSAGQAGSHKIKAYYAVPRTKLDIQQAILAFGPLVLGMNWYGSWFHPVNGVLPEPSGGIVGGHAIAAIGWDSRGLHLRNSWGASWGIGGDCFIPWSYALAAWEVWKAIDVIETAPVSTHKVLIEANTVVLFAQISGACISGWTRYPWGPSASSASCGAPYILPGCSNGQATVVSITSTTGPFAGKVVRVGSGVTVTAI